MFRSVPFQKPKRNAKIRAVTPIRVPHRPIKSNTISLIQFSLACCPPTQFIQTPPTDSHAPLVRTSYQRHNRPHSRMRGRAPGIRRHAPRRGDRLTRGALPLFLLARNQRGRRRLRRREREMRAAGQTGCIGEGLTKNCAKKKSA